MPYATLFPLILLVAFFLYLILLPPRERVEFIYSLGPSPFANQSQPKTILLLDETNVGKIGILPIKEEKITLADDLILDYRKKSDYLIYNVSFELMSSLFHYDTKTYYLGNLLLGKTEENVDNITLYVTYSSRSSGILSIKIGDKVLARIDKPGTYQVNVDKKSLLNMKIISFTCEYSYATLSLYDKCIVEDVNMIITYYPLLESSKEFDVAEKGIKSGSIEGLVIEGSGELEFYVNDEKIGSKTIYYIPTKITIPFSIPEEVKKIKVEVKPNAYAEIVGLGLKLTGKNTVEVIKEYEVEVWDLNQLSPKNLYKLEVYIGSVIASGSLTVEIENPEGLCYKESKELKEGKIDFILDQSCLKPGLNYLRIKTDGLANVDRILFYYIKNYYG